MLKELNKLIEKKFARSDTDIIYDADRDVEAITTGSVVLDSVTGVGGMLVKGRLTEIVGLESSGKTTICLQSAANAQKAGQVGIFIDVEQTFDAFYAKQLGLEINDTFAVYQPSCAEQVEMIIDLAVKELGKNLDYIIWDSLAATLPKAMLEDRQKEDESSQKGQQAAFMSRYFPKLNTQARANEFAVMVTNQLRQKIQFGSIYQAKAVKDGGLAAGFSNDTSWYSMGGNAVKYYYSMRFLLEQVRRQKVDNDGDVDEIGNWIRIKNLKNKVSVPFKQAEFVIIFGEGTNDNLAILYTLENYEIVYSEGRTWYYEGSTKNLSISKGNIAKDKFFDMLTKDKKIMEDAKKQYLELLNQNNRVSTRDDIDDEIELDEGEIDEIELDDDESLE